MINTNVELSKKEYELVVDKEFILTKNRIVEKAVALFGLLSEAYKPALKAMNTQLPAEIFEQSPKIFKGENYLQLPYVMLDYPRVFGKEDVFAIRSFFWWGNYFSSTLHLSGKFLQHYGDNITAYLKQTNLPYYVCINSSPWQHTLEPNNYKLFTGEDIASLASKPFIKIAASLPLNEWNKAENFFKKNYASYLEMLTGN